MNEQDRKHNCVYYHIFEVNRMLVVANTIDEAIALWRECYKDEEVKSVHICRDGDCCLAKIATKEDIWRSYGKEGEE
ncbi:MAG: hypothetical protein ACI3ZK_07370 [Candidatus Cryptobacteroides sp.]